jgi:hypothetical protein
MFYGTIDAGRLDPLKTVIKNKSASVRDLLPGWPS